MDPVTAFGLAAGVLQFVQFSSDIFKNAYGTLKISQGPIKNGPDAICKRLDELSQELHGRTSPQSSGPRPTSSPASPDIDTQEEELLHELAENCRKDCKKLTSRLEMLRRSKGPRRFWKSLKDALKDKVPGDQDSLRQMQDRIKQYESSLTLHMCAVML